MGRGDVKGANKLRVEAVGTGYWVQSAGSAAGQYAVLGSCYPKMDTRSPG